MADINEILADVKPEGDTDPFASMEKETPTESLPEKEPDTKEPNQGETEETQENTDDNTPYHIRWKERETKLREELNQEFQEQFEKYKLELEQKIPQSEEPTQVPEWFGGSEEAWNKYVLHERQIEERIEQKIIQNQELARKQADEEVQHWNKWVDNEIDRLQSEGKQFDRNELIKVMLDVRPTTEDGNSFDFDAGYKIYEAMKFKDADPAKSHARKALADTTNKSSNQGEKQTKDYMTPAYLRNKSWNSIGE